MFIESTNGISISEITDKVNPVFAFFCIFLSISIICASVFTKWDNIIPEIGKQIFIRVKKKHESSETIPKMNDNSALCLIFFNFHLLRLFDFKYYTLKYYKNQQ